MSTASHNCIRRTGPDAKGAADTPVFIDNSHRHGPFTAANRVNLQSLRQSRLPHCLCNTHHTLFAARWAPIDGCFPLSNGLRISKAILFPATPALCLRQNLVDTLRKPANIPPIFIGRQHECTAMPIKALVFWCRTGYIHSGLSGFLGTSSIRWRTTPCGYRSLPLGFRRRWHNGKR